MTVSDDTRQRTHDIRLEFEIHGQVGLVPLTDHAQAFEIRTLAIDLFRGIGAAGFAKFRGGHFHTGLAHFLLHL